MRLRLKNELSEVSRANDALRELWVREALPEDLEATVSTCLEEVLSNVIRHGGASGEIHAEYRIAPGAIEIEISDDGPAFDPLTLPPPELSVPLEQRRAGGLGVFLVRRLMDDVRYELRDGRNHLIFRKNWPL